MRAIHQSTYGSPDVLELRELPEPSVGPHDVLVAVHASPVTQGDRRLRSADFPGISALLGRFLIGFLGPRKAVPGTNFAGRVVAVGDQVTRFKVGQDVFGSADAGAHAELLLVAEDGPVAPQPAHLSYEEAAAVPYGAGTALVFLTELAKLQAGQRIAILGAGGGVGRYAVQLAAHLGAEVTAVAGQRSFELLRELGATHLVDYSSQDFTESGERYDVVLDLVDASSFARSRAVLTERGLYLSLHMTFRNLWDVLRHGRGEGQRAGFGLAMPAREHTLHLARLLELRVLRPVLGVTVPFEQIARAHELVDAGRIGGDVVVEVRSAAGLRLAAK